ncbi:MAG: alpha/beta fold hydrolase [bacterium]
MLPEQCVSFRNPEGHLLRGILHPPSPDRKRGVSVLLLNTGLNDMTGWHRVQVKLARHLARLGYAVLRFDDAGIGDSEGDIPDESIVKIFARIESGLFVPDALAAVDFMVGRFSEDRLVCIGFCGGGVTAVHAAAGDTRICGMVDVGGPVTLSSEEHLQKTDPWEARNHVRSYRAKIFQIGPWIRFLSGGKDYGTVFRSLLHYLRHLIGGRYREPPKGRAAENDNPRNLNRLFFSSFEKYARSMRPLLFYFAELDAATWEFKKHFLNRYKPSPLWSDSLFRFVEIQKANHIFSDPDSREQMKRDLVDWLRRFD